MAGLKAAAKPTGAKMPQSQQQQEHQQQQPTLTFPASHYAKLVPADFLRASLTSSAGVRPNGRTATQVRDATINAGSLSNANGSAVVRLGSTSVVCGVRAELLPVSHIHGGLPAELEAWQEDGIATTGVDDEDNEQESSRQRLQGTERGHLSSSRSDADLIAELRLLVPNLELSTGCNPAHLPGNAPSTEAQSLTMRILSLLQTTDLVALAPLVVWHRTELNADGDGTGDDRMDDESDKAVSASKDTGTLQIKALWTLYIDILYISLDGAAFDAAWLAVLAALRDTKLPQANWDEDHDTFLCSPMRADAKRLQLNTLPVPLTAGLFTYVQLPPTITTDRSDQQKPTEVVAMLYDPDDFEESVCQGHVAVLVTANEQQRKQNSKASKRQSGGSLAKTKLLRTEASGLGASTALVAVLSQAAEERWAAWQAVLDWPS